MAFSSRVLDMMVFELALKRILLSACFTSEFAVDVTVFVTMEAAQSIKYFITYGTH